MITSLSTSLTRVTIFWYIIGALFLFVGDPEWAEAIYQRLMVYPWVPVLEMHGLGTAAAVQWRLLLYWTVPMLMLWAVSLGVGAFVAEVKCQLGLRKQRLNLKPTGSFWNVTVPAYSLGRLPRATTPALTGQSVTLGGAGADVKGKKAARVELQGAMKEAVKMLTPAERQLAEELLQLLLQAPDHYAGLGHGVGLLEHTLNVVTEAAAKVTPEFRMPLLAALSHDIGKLITFQPDGKGGWKRKGLHSRESARILATLPAFQELPELHQRALLLAVKYDHAPNKMPELRGEREACTLALRTISALSQADRKATADEKERHLERLQPEDLLWKDFVDFLREAPVVQRGKKGVANQVNNPPDSPYLFLYEAPWRDEAVRRLPAEVAAALDLTRRDAGKMAKYTRILVDRLRKEGLLVETYTTKDKDGAAQELKVSDSNPLWDIQSGTGEKAVVLRGILVLKADDLWKKLNYRISVKSPFPVQILAPNADAAGRVNEAPRANRDEPRTPDVSDGLKLADVESTDAMAALGLTSEPTEAAKTSKPKTRARGGFRSAPVTTPADDAMFGLKTGEEPAKAESPAPTEQDPVAVTPADTAGREDSLDQEAQEMAELAAAMGNESAPEAPAEEDSSSTALNNALAYLTAGDAGDEQPVPEASAIEVVEEVVEPSAPDEQSVPPQPANSEATAPVAAAEVKPVKQADASTKKPKEDAPKEAGNQPVAETTAKAPARTAEQPTESPAELSRAEKREGLAIADAAAVAQYPGLKVGDKFYTEHSRAVQAGLKKPGSRYKGDNREKALDLTESGPRRGRRRLTS
ncbi:hypothetical protein [Burkholderia ubonensis]|uniref:hypothetical protein n=1 Tax=Burkholderia ubonensis TaxID=101571 RepID=UPI0007541CFA|nr:hypothetical protein [Burkholderia ubonensis]KVP16798.1 hypothetical protein WJ84_00560 [Burkholderia ubonensis]